MSYRLDISYFSRYVLLCKQKEHLKMRAQYKQLVPDSMAFYVSKVLLTGTEKPCFQIIQVCCTDYQTLVCSFTLLNIECETK